MKEESNTHSLLTKVPRLIRTGFPPVFMFFCYQGYIAIGAIGLYYMEEKPVNIKVRHGMGTIALEIDKLMEYSAYFPEGGNISEELLSIKVYCEDILNKSSDPSLMWKERGFVLQDIVDYFYFVIETITTIGYGTLPPRTVAGRAFCITVALIGIPFTLFVLHVVGGLMAKLTIFIYVGVKKRLKRSKYIGKTSSVSLNHDCPKYSKQDDVTDITKSSAEDDSSVKFENVSGFDSDTMNNNPTDKPINETTVCLNDCYHLEILHKKTIELQAKNEETEEEAPVLVVFLLLMLFVTMNSSYLAYFNKWGYGQSVYFVVVTFTTIGYGDLQEKSQRMFAIYLGLAMMSMCFTLLQARMGRTVQRVRHKLQL